jgi:hypothetical protein
MIAEPDQLSPEPGDLESATHDKHFGRGLRDERSDQASHLGFRLFSVQRHARRGNARRSWNARA